MRQELKHALGVSVRSFRVAREIPQEGLGPSQPYISSLEAGRGTASIGKIEQMAQVLNVHPLSLIMAGYLSSTDGLTVELLLEQIRADLKIIGL